MHIKFWGTRGSISKPGATTVRYGGNTSCIELISSQGTLLVIDCGTGGHGLGLELTSKLIHKRGHMLISHTHWDHIQGIPFFAPFFMSDAEWDIYGPKNLSQSIQEALEGQMQHIYFPVSINQLGATMRFHSLVEGTFQINDIKVTVHYLNHPVITCGYRIEVDGVVIVYSCDYEPNSTALLTKEDEISEPDRKHLEFLADADLVIHDAQYTLNEYPAKIGWGHSPIEYAVKICQLAGVKQLALTHHDPLRDDASIDKILKKVHENLKKQDSALKVFAAAEGTELDLNAIVAQKNQYENKKQNSAEILSKTILSEQSIIIYVSNEATRTILSEAIHSNGIQATFVADSDEMMKKILAENTSLVLIEHDPPVINGIGICSLIREKIHDADNTLPIVIIADKEETDLGKQAGVTEWLIKPFTSNYARSKIHAWILRVACRWHRAPIPINEAQRLAALHKLNILDTEQEERFNRITRLTSALFDIPVVLISLVDANRQWFKSCYGIDLKETDREVSFCAHVVNSQQSMIVSDMLLDNRFADNPYVLNEPHIRFYAGAPLILKDGSCIGTLCCLDTRPRVLREEELQLLHDLRDLAMNEIVKS